MRLLIICITIITLFCTSAFSAETGGAQVDSSINVRSHGAKGDGLTDDTAAIQTAMNEAAKSGGIVYIPAGKYLVKDHFSVPAGVQVKGAALAPNYSEPLVGTIILATGGRDKEDGPALFEMTNSTAVTGLTIYYPDQKPTDIHPYPWTFRLQGYDNTVENVTLINSYNGIVTGPANNVRHRIRSVYGCVLRRGIFIDACTDIGRIENVQFHGHWWWAASVGGNADVVNKYMIDNLEAFIFGRTDWEYVTNTFVFPVKIGYRFIATKDGACNGQFVGIGSDYSQKCVVVDAIQPMGLLITNGQFVAFAGDNPVEVEISPTCDGSVRLVNCAFWGHADQNVVMHGKGFLSLSDCYLSSGKHFEDKALVEADSGKLQVRGCTFGTGEPCIDLKKGLKHAIITENNGKYGVNVRNEIGDAAIIANNEPRVKK